jgi:predicted enzyme related to lactoylglutathione lyase
MTTPPRHWWHELNTWEPEIALAFYGRTLGWQFDAAPLPDGSAYWIARQEGSPVGGIFELTAPHYSGIPSHWMTYMAVTGYCPSRKGHRQSGRRDHASGRLMCQGWASSQSSAIRRER